MRASVSAKHWVDASRVKLFRKNGFVLIDNLLDEKQVGELKSRFNGLFAGKFDTGIYPDEWHWREGISKPDAFREIVNGYKADTVIRSVVLSETIGKVACELMGWSGSRVGQDDVLWKPPLASEVGFHQDSAYISTQFLPYENSSVTIWIALDDADEETGVVEYCPGSHLWTIPKTAHSAVESTFHGELDYQAGFKRAAKLAGKENDMKIVRIPVKAGSAIFHHQDVWHGSDRNKSTTRHRRALGIHLLNKDVKWRTSSPPDYIYGRYYIPGEPSPRDTFFPITFDSQSDDDDAAAASKR